MPSGPNANARVRIALLFLFFGIVLSVGAWFAGDLSRLQDRLSARESRAALQGIGDPARLDEALRQNPSNRFLQMMAMAARAANETDAATEKLTSEIEPPAISKTTNLGAASRSDLEALRRDLKTAEANATTFLPRYAAVLKTERDSVEKYALSQPLGKDAVRRVLDISTSGTPTSRPLLPGRCRRAPTFIAPMKTMSRSWSANSALTG